MGITEEEFQRRKVVRQEACQKWNEEFEQGQQARKEARLKREEEFRLQEEWRRDLLTSSSSTLEGKREFKTRTLPPPTSDKRARLKQDDGDYGENQLGVSKAIPSRGEKEESSVMESAQQSNNNVGKAPKLMRTSGMNELMNQRRSFSTRLRLEDENFHLALELRLLEEKKEKIWKELVSTNNWAHYESDEEVQALVKEIDEKTLQKQKVLTLLREENKNIEVMLESQAMEMVDTNGEKK